MEEHNYQLEKDNALLKESNIEKDTQIDLLE